MLTAPKSAHIDFIRPVKGPVHAVIRISKEDEMRIRERTAGGAKYLPEFEVQILDDEEEPVALVRKVVYVRKKNSAA